VPDRNFALGCRLKVDMVNPIGIRRDDFDRRRNALEELGIEPVKWRNQYCVSALSRGEEFVACKGRAVSFTPDFVFAFDPGLYRLDEMRCDNQDGLLHEISSPEKSALLTERLFISITNGES
jgi:hypothetical protein